MTDLPILYSFRRCPYAMRARMALAHAGITVELREVVLKNKPPELLAASIKATVPVLQLPDDKVLDESLEIMRWALNAASSDWLSADAELTNALIATNDGPFKHWLDRYKYFERHPEQPMEHYREQALNVLISLGARLASHKGEALLGKSKTLADYALMPFVRQFAHCDIDWFNRQPLPNLIDWLETIKAGSLFTSVMKKYPAWESGQQAVLFQPAAAAVGGNTRH